MKTHLQNLFTQAFDRLRGESVLSAEAATLASSQIGFERTRNQQHGDFATNIAMVLAKQVGMSPRDLATLIIANIADDSLVEKLDVAGPGFINIYLASAQRLDIVKQILRQGVKFGHVEAEQRKKILIEFVSANPTGPLHVGHGRGAAYGDAMARILRAAGHEVETEYYVNDAGRQMDILALSVWIRYIQDLGEDVELPANAYQGEYIKQLAKEIAEIHGGKLSLEAKNLQAATEGRDTETAIDALIALVKTELPDNGFSLVFDYSLQQIRGEIEQDLRDLGIEFTTWFSEKSLLDDGKLKHALERLRDTEYMYEKDGALWFKSSALGDEKDRVVVRDNSLSTYFASDIAYQVDKIERGFDLCINIWGADHHGYIARMKAAMQALSMHPEKLHIMLVQFAVLFRGKEQLKMTTRGGTFVTLSDLSKEIGRDAVRFYYVQRKSEQHMNFDLELAKSKSNDNPVYYIQYAHARICSIFREALKDGIEIQQLGDADLSLLKSAQEQYLIDLLERYPEVVQKAAADLAPHQLSYYLRDLAQGLHTYYNGEKILILPSAEKLARLSLIAAVRQVLANGLDLIGVSAPEKM